MPCLQPIPIRNKYHGVDLLSGEVLQSLPDSRDRYHMVPCGKCYECLRKKAADWRFRLLQELRYATHNDFFFVTLTFSDESLDALASDSPDTPLNGLVKIAVRRFLERYRAKYGKSLRHFFITELGGKLGRIHLHGVIIAPRCLRPKTTPHKVDIPVFTDLWSYGYTWVGWCTQATMSYTLKYIFKGTDDYRPIILCSPGIGRAYVNAAISWHRQEDGRFYCVTSTGHKVGLPRYYSLKIFSDIERWLRRMYLMQYPPPVVFRGITFDSILDYQQYRDLFIRHTEKLLPNLKHSRVSSRIPIEPNLEFSW